MTGQTTALTERLRAALDLALDTVTWAAGFDFPDFQHDHEMLALVTPGQYAIDRDTVASTGGLSFAPAEFEDYVIEEHVPHSTALHARLAGRGRYLTGPTARYNLSGQWLSPLARQAADAAGLITSARIVPPTSQNQASIEDDLRRFVAGRLDLDDEQLTRQCEQAIRNYDPCISCSTHFLDLTVDRG